MLVQIEAETLHFAVFGRELIEKLHPLSQFQFQLGGASVFGAFVIDVIEFFASPELLAGIKPHAFEEVDHSAGRIRTESRIADLLRRAFIRKIKTCVHHLRGKHHTRLNAQIHRGGFIARIPTLCQAAILVFPHRSNHPAPHTVGNPGLDGIGFITRISGNRIADQHRRISDVGHFPPNCGPSKPHNHNSTYRRTKDDSNGGTTRTGPRTHSLPLHR